VKTVEDLERAIRELSPGQLAEFRRWFADYDSAIWDDQIAQDAASGRLDSMIEEARRDDREGRTRPL
jgi:hypothetical protein